MSWAWRRRAPPAGGGLRPKSSTVVAIAATGVMPRCARFTSSSSSPSSSSSSSSPSSRVRAEGDEAQERSLPETGSQQEGPSPTPTTSRTRPVHLVVSESLLRGLQRTKRELHRDVFLNPDRASSLKHVELTNDTIRLEFSKATPEYRRHAELMFMTEEEREEKGVEDWAVPRRLKNMTFCGGGATIELDRRKVMEFLNHRRITKDEHAEEETREDETRGKE